MNKKLYFLVLLSPNLAFANIINTCAGELMPVIEDKYKIICANTLGIIPDSGNDISDVTVHREWLDRKKETIVS